MKKPNPIGAVIEVKFMMKKTFFHAPSCPYNTTVVLWLPISCSPFTATVSGFVKRYEGFITNSPDSPTEWTPTGTISLIAVRRSPFAAEVITAYSPADLQPYLELAHKENPGAPY